MVCWNQLWKLWQLDASPHLSNHFPVVRISKHPDVLSITNGLSFFYNRSHCFSLRIEPSARRQLSCHWLQSVCITPGPEGSVLFERYPKSRKVETKREPRLLWLRNNCSIADSRSFSPASTHSATRASRAAPTPCTATSSVQNAVPNTTSPTTESRPSSRTIHLPGFSRFTYKPPQSRLRRLRSTFTDTTWNGARSATRRLTANHVLTVTERLAKNADKLTWTCWKETCPASWIKWNVSRIASQKHRITCRKEWIWWRWTVRRQKQKLKNISTGKEKEETGDKPSGLDIKENWKRKKTTSSLKSIHSKRQRAEPWVIWEMF